MSWAQIDTKLEKEPNEGEKTVEQKIKTSENISAVVKEESNKGELKMNQINKDHEVEGKELGAEEEIISMVESGAEVEEDPNGVKQAGGLNSKTSDTNSVDKEERGI